VIPIELPDTVLVQAEGIPIFRAHYGTARGNRALKVAEFIKRPSYHLIGPDETVGAESE
jgi:flagellar motor switch protein FliM